MAPQPSPAVAPGGSTGRRHPLSCLPTGWPEGEREAKRRALRRVLDGAVAGNEGGLYYYQGLHDVAAVLLFVCGEPAAYRLLRALAACHLRDCTRPDLAAATETLRLLYPILEQVGCVCVCVCVCVCDRRKERDLQLGGVAHTLASRRRGAATTLFLSSLCTAVRHRAVPLSAGAAGAGAGGALLCAQARRSMHSKGRTAPGGALHGLAPCSVAHPSNLSPAPSLIPSRPAALLTAAGT